MAMDIPVLALRALGVPALVCSFLALTGCAATEFSGSGYKHTVHGISIDYIDKYTRSLVTTEWDIANYDYDYTGRRFTRKRSVGYFGELAFDRNMDDKPKMESTYFADLVLTHDRTNGLIYLCTRDLMPNQEEIPFDFFIAHYVRSLVSEDKMLCGDVFGFVPTDKKYEVKFESKETVELFGKQGVAVTVSLIDPEAGDGASAGKARVLFTKIQSEVTVFRPDHEGGDHYQIPGQVLLILGHFNEPASFESTQKDFEQFVNQLYF